MPRWFRMRRTRRRGWCARPRADVAFLDGSMPIAEAAAYVREMPYSRYPVTGKDFDDVLGFVHVRDLLDIRDPKARTLKKSAFEV